MFIELVNVLTSLYIPKGYVKVKKYHPKIEIKETKKGNVGLDTVR